MKEYLYEIISKNLVNLTIRNFVKGQMVEGIVEKVDSSFVILKVDNLFDVLVPYSELIDSKNPPAVGEKVKVFILKNEDEYGNIIASQKRTTPSQRWVLLEESLKNGDVLLVEVIESNNGGVLVVIDGVMGFIPTSQLDPNRLYKVGDISPDNKDILNSHEINKKLSSLIGSKIKVKVTEIDKQKGRVIFSEKLALNDSLSVAKLNALQKYKIGDILEGTVTAVTNYGIFVNADGLDGLVHVSEISWDKVNNPSDYAKVGDVIKVKLIDLDESGNRVAFSMKQITEDPWKNFVKKYKVGSIVNCVVFEIEDYGLIVKVDTGITGLIHKSEIDGNSSNDLSSSYKVGQELQAVILTIAPSERRMGLSIKRLKDYSEKPGQKTIKKKSVKKKVIRKGSGINLDAVLNDKNNK